MRVVAAPHGLGGVEGRVLPDRDERVLQLRPLPRVRVDVARGHAGDAEPPRERLELAVLRTVVPREGPLELDPQPLGTEGGQQPAQPGLVADPLAGAAREADEPLRVLREVRERDGRCDGPPPRRVTGVGVGAGEQPAEVPPAHGVADQQRHVAQGRRLPHGATQDRPAGDLLLGRRWVALVAHGDLRPVDRPQPERPRRLRELHGARDRVVVRQRHRRVPPLERRDHELLGLRGPVEEGEGGVRVELDVRRHERMFADSADGFAPIRWPPPCRGGSPSAPPTPRRPGASRRRRGRSPSA